MQKNTTRHLLSLGLLGLALAWPSVSRAVPIWSPSNWLPPEDTKYISFDQWHACYAMGIYIADPKHWAFTASYPPPTGGGTKLESFGSRLDANVSVDGGVTYSPMWASGNVTVRITDDGGGVYSTEMLQMDLSGGSLPAGVMLRESPTLASTGHTTITPAAGGGYMIDSFFDIFTELSLDGGQTWFPDQCAPGTVWLIPEPSSSILAGLGLFGLLAYARRGRK